MILPIFIECNSYNFQLEFLHEIYRIIIIIVKVNVLHDIKLQWEGLYKDIANMVDLEERMNSF